MSSSPTRLPTPEGPGSVSGAPHLPAGFTGTFTSRYVDTGDLRQHVVTGGDGPPLLLVHGWPQTWYAWRLVMPALARDFFVVAPDQRGTGLSGKPADGYDTGTLAGDLVALMDALGHQRFALAGHDTGMWIGYALAADHPDRLDRLAVAETPLPGVSPSPPLFANAHLNNALWHFAFNRLAEVNDQLATGREDLYFGWQFATKAAKKLPDYAVRHYVDTLTDPEALHASFAIYRALDATIAQNQQRMTRRLTLPVLAIGGAHSLGEQVADTMKLAADDVQSLVVPGCGHHPAEETPEETLAALTAFLAPYRDGTATAHNPKPHAATHQPLAAGDDASSRALSSYPHNRRAQGTAVGSRKELLMSIKSKVLAAAATLTMAGGLSTAGTLPATAATPQCGPHCIQIFSAKFGTNANPNFVETVFQGVGTAGQPTILARASSSDTAGDLIATAPGAGLVSDFFAAGLVSAAVNSHYGTERAAQIEYAPLGVPTGLCAALATTAFQNEGLTLQPCSTPGTTVWIIDTTDSPATAPARFPIVNGSTTDFTHPFAMIIHGDPAHKPFPQITVQHLIDNPTDVPDSQLWGANVFN